MKLHFGQLFGRSKLHDLSFAGNESELAGFQPDFHVYKTCTETISSDRSFRRRYPQMQLQVVSILVIIDPMFCENAERGAV
jgi:hypothetical protein